MRNFWKVGLLKPFDANSSLFSTAVFQISLLVFFIAACFSFWAVSQAHSLSLCTDITQGANYWAACISNLWEYHTQGFFVFGSFFPIAALIASHLRSVQAADQIRKQKEQNQFENHFKHSEQFIRAWDEQKLSGLLPNSFSLRELHGLIYPYSPKGNYEISEAYTQRVVHVIDLMNDLIKCPNNKSDGIKQRAICEKIFSNLKEGLKLADFLHYKYEFFPYHGRDVQSALGEYKDLLNRLIAAISFFQEHSARGLEKKMGELELSEEIATAAREDKVMEEYSSRIKRLISDIASGHKELKKAKAKELGKLWEWEDIPLSSPAHALSSPTDYRIKATFPFELAFSKSVFNELPEKITNWMTACSDEHQVNLYEARQSEPWV